MTRARLQRLFLFWGRPLAPAAALLTYGVVNLVRPTDRATHMVELLVGSIVLGVVYGLALDTLLIAAMTSAPSGARSSSRSRAPRRSGSRRSFPTYST